MAPIPFPIPWCIVRTTTNNRAFVQAVNVNSNIVYKKCGAVASVHHHNPWLVGTQSIIRHRGCTKKIMCKWPRYIRTYPGEARDGILNSPRTRKLNSVRLTLPQPQITINQFLLYYTSLDRSIYRTVSELILRSSGAEIVETLRDVVRCPRRLIVWEVWPDL